MDRSLNVLKPSQVFSMNWTPNSLNDPVKNTDSISGQIQDMQENFPRCGTLKDRYSRTLLHAAHDGSTGRVRDILNRGADANYKGPNQLTALHHAAYYGFNEVILILIAKGADVNATSSECGTPLCLAVTREHTKTVELLLKNGAKVNALGGCFGSALHAACFLGQGRNVRLLLEAEKNVTMRRDVRLLDCTTYRPVLPDDMPCPTLTFEQCDPLFCAAAVDNDYAIAKLLERGAPIDTKVYVESSMNLDRPVHIRIPFDSITFPKSFQRLAMIMT